MVNLVLFRIRLGDDHPQVPRSILVLEEGTEFCRVIEKGFEVKFDGFFDVGTRDRYVDGTGNVGKAKGGWKGGGYGSRKLKVRYAISVAIRDH